ncbi:phage tail tape measure protein [Rhodococcus pyridinivorans]|uniref:phage tail tape measure protein n=1 Tax=Rhodococcus pyridinivorans TaxID=103816 RepID=UPI00280BC218|nr:phage tail tape measure protein [Rhodococcus pyridinivorans]WMM74476.1 phage tail tape measure protein [Rhodococcus pyridinivorans]
MATANKIFIQINADGSKAVTEFGKTADSVDRLSGTSSRAEATMASLGRTLARGAAIAGGALVAGLGVAIKSAGDYESSLSQLRQASGATNKEMAGMSELARQLGQSNDLAGVSAADAARTMVELSKAGLSVKDTMDSSKAVMSLARAGNIDFAEAAIIAASSLNAFGLEGKQATQVADMLAAGANASQADLADLALGLQQSATVAKQFKLSLNENVTALSLFANNGIKGSDAGTSLKTMLISLAKPSEASAKLMKQIGFEAYNASGEFVGLEEMSKRLAKATSTMTEEQKQNALATIFGTDAFRAAAVLADNAGDSYAKMSKAVGQSGAAQQAAAAQMGPYEKSIEGLKNTVSELGLAVGTELLPFATTATNALSDLVGGVTGHLPAASRVIDDFVGSATEMGREVGSYLVPKVAALWTTVQTKLIPALSGAWRAASPLASLLGGALVVAIGATVRVLDATIQAVSFLSPVIFGAVAAWVAYRGVVLAASAVTAAHSALIFLSGTRYIMMNGALIAVTGATTAATIAQAAWNMVLSMNPIGLAIGAVVGLTVAVAVLANSTRRVTEEERYQNDVRTKSIELSRQIKEAEDQLNNSRRESERNSLAVERAQRSLDEAIRQYGEGSLEAREAALNLKDANDRLNESNGRVKQSTEVLTEAQRQQRDMIADINARLDGLNGKSVTYTIEGKEMVARNYGEHGTVHTGKFWTGGFTGRGAKREPAGVVHKGEYVLPQEMVDQSTGMPDLSKVLSKFGSSTPTPLRAPSSTSSTNTSNGGGGGVTVNITGPVTFANGTDIDAFAERLNRAQRLALKGAA